MVRWSTTTKRWVLTGIVIGIVWAVYRFSNLLPPIVLAILLAYILNPLVGGLTRHFRLPRVLSALLIYLGFLLLVFFALLIFIPAAVRQVQDLDINFTQVAQDLAAYLKPTLDRFSHIEVFGTVIILPLDFDQLRATLEGNLSSVGSRGVNLLFGFTSGFASGLFLIVLILFISFYLLKDGKAAAGYLSGLVPAGYEDEVRQMTREVEDVWNAFLRGQLILCGVIGLLTYVALLILGMPNALLLGVLAGILEIVPNLGPILAMIPAVVVALLQGSNTLPFDHLTFAGIVVLTYFIIQQLENNLVVPRIIGGSVNLHPIVVILGVVAGADLAGILGIFLAAPTLATLRILGRHIYLHLLEESAQPVVTAAPGPVPLAVVVVSGPKSESASSAARGVPVLGADAVPEPEMKTSASSESGSVPSNPDIVTG
ncbi:MAG: AI-2E family transporter [Chloroflexi bacterium]|nr:AI-2E family transporter [Chloroflexota bacterium]